MPFAGTVTDDDWAVTMGTYVLPSERIPCAMTHEMARALCDAGYISVAEYIRLCHENGWPTKIQIR